MKKLTLATTFLFSAILTACGGSSSSSSSTQSTIKIAPPATATEKSATLESYSWAFNAGSSVKSTAVISNGNVIFGTNTGKVFALNIDDGSEVWQREFNGQISGKLTLIEERILRKREIFEFYKHKLKNSAFTFLVEEILIKALNFSELANFIHLETSPP